MQEYLFSYGTIQQEEVQLELFGRQLIGQTDRLFGYTISTILISHNPEGTEIKHYLIASASTNNGDFIEGKVFELSADELLIADEYESDEYIRIYVRLNSGSMAWIYAAAESI